MTPLIITGSVLAASATYLITGWRLALRDLPNAWTKARTEWSSDRNIRSSVKEQTVTTLLLWPIAIPVRRFSFRLDELATESDPVELQRQLDERATYIAKLERELGIGQREDAR